MSTLVGTIVEESGKRHPEFSAPQIGEALAIIVGAIVAALGFLRLGFIVDFIPLPAIFAFMTGSAINIISGQVGTMFGEKKKVSTSDPTYWVIIHTLQNLPTSTVDAAMGVTALIMLYVIRFGCNYSAKRWPSRAKIFFFASTLRTVFVLLFYVMISAAVNVHRKDNPRFKLLGHVPRGFQAAGRPLVNTDIIKVFATELPASVIVLLIEHISISKSFGRVNNYTIDPSQEMVAIGVSNLLGPFLGAYPATGSFSRTAIKSKAGVRTPMAGVITAIVVLLAIYALPALFFYIPKASLAGVIIHAVGDLITPPNVVYQFWRVSPLDMLIFFLGVIVTIFSSIENGVYCTICVSAALLLFRVAKARGALLGQVRIHSVVGDHLVDDRGRYGTFPNDTKLPVEEETPVGRQNNDDANRTVFLPLNHCDGSNPSVKLEQPYPGIFLYRFSEGLNYPNANHYTDDLVQNIFQLTRRTNPFSYGRLGDRPWNNPGPSRGQSDETDMDIPTLKAIILDFSSVNNVDATAVQTLIDVRNQLDIYASPDVVQWHFAHINNRWTKRALAAAGFGYPSFPSDDGFHRWKPIFSVAEIGGDLSAAATAELRLQREYQRKVDMGNVDVEAGRNNTAPDANASGVDGDDVADIKPTESKVPFESVNQYDNNNGSASNSDIDDKEDQKRLHRDLTSSKAYADRREAHVVQGINRPFFHIDLNTALQSAIANVHDSSAVASFEHEGRVASHDHSQ